MKETQIPKIMPRREHREEKKLILWMNSNSELNEYPKKRLVHEERNSY